MKLPRITSLIVGAIVLLFVLPSAVDFYTDWLWFQELGYNAVFLRTINAQTVVFLATAVFVFAFLYGNWRIARPSMPRPRIVLGRGVDGREIAVEGRQVTGVSLWIAIIAAGLLGFAASNTWLQWLTFLNAVPFGDKDPLFGRDIAFYVFKLPVYTLLRQQLLTTTVLALVGCGVYYVFSGNVAIDARYGMAFWPQFRFSPRARGHLAILGAFMLGLMAWGAWLDVFRTLLTPATVVFGASYADTHARIPFLRAEMVVLGLAAALTLWHGFSRLRWPLPIGIGLYFLVSVSGAVYGSIIENFIATPNQLETEEPYIVHHIAATRRAYALDRVDQRELSGDGELTKEKILDNAATVENVRLWDHEPLLQTFAQIQEIRTYYDFGNVDNDRYTINGKYRQVMLSARELNTDNMTNRSWNNERLQFTHGYGITLGPVNQVTTEGLPVLFIRDLPPVSTVDLKLEEPSIYYGEYSNSYVLVRTKQPEFHYPRPDTNETTVYSGTGGVPVGGLARRFLFAVRFATTNILVTDQITSESRILFHRRISDRVRLIAPFLKLDSDPYPVVSGGKLFWIQDAYTTSANYPYSQRSIIGRDDEINYIRNSVKIVVDAYNGSTTFYLSTGSDAADQPDPIALTLAKVFPGMLHPLSDMPAGLREHVRYPEDIFKIQSLVYATYHMTGVKDFYNKEDQWQLPTTDVNPSAAAATVFMQPYYTIMKLPGEKQAEFIQMLPFTPRAKENLSAWLAARSDGAHYGRLVAFQFPKQKIIYGPRQIVGRMSQDQVISPQITLWGQQGSEVIWGTLLVIPIDDSLLYVRPLYLRSTQGRIPELKRVVVAYKDQIVMEETLTKGLGRIFGPAVVAGLAPDRLESSATSVVTTPDATDLPEAGVPTVTPVTPGTLSELAAEAQKHYDKAYKALEQKDLATFSQEMQRVGEILKEMNKIKK